MSVAVVLALGVVGGLGAVARFVVDHAVSERAGRAFPFGTLVVNVSGSFALGVLVGAGVDGDAYRLAATGALGAFTTFSTLALETHRLGQEGRARAALNVALSLAAGVAAVWLGRHVASI